MKYLPFILAAVFLGLGIYFLPGESKPVTPHYPLPSVSSAPSKPEPPAPPLPKPKPVVNLIGEYDWQVFLPQGSEWVNTGRKAISERGTPVYFPRQNSIAFITDDWFEAYLVRTGDSQTWKPTSRYFSVQVNEGECLPVYVKNITNHDLTMEMVIHNRPSQNNPPECK